jgi:hypothetical protein
MEDTQNSLQKLLCFTKIMISCLHVHIVQYWNENIEKRKFIFFKHNREDRKNVLLRLFRRKAFFPQKKSANLFLYFLEKKPGRTPRILSKDEDFEKITPHACIVSREKNNHVNIYFLFIEIFMYKGQ